MFFKKPDFYIPIIFVLIFIKPLKLSSNNFSSIPNFRFKFVFPCLYIGVVIQRPNSKRVPSLLKAWGNEFASQPGNVLRLFTPFNESKKSDYIKHVKVNDTVSTSYRLIFYSNYASAHDFYENTTLLWYLRTTYDCFIHLKNLYRYIQKLSRQYDPNKDIVMKGFYANYFIHGGPGWIMSRAAVKQYLKIEKEMKSEYNRNMEGDDVNIMFFVKKFNLSFKKVHEPEFAGWPVKDSSYKLLIDSNFSYENVTTVCRYNLMPSKVNSIIIWHNGRRKDYVNTIGKKIIDEAPEFLGLHYMMHIGGDFCRFQSVKPVVRKKIIVKRRKRRRR